MSTTPEKFAASQTPAGSFKRTASSFRNTISKDGQYTPEKGRYHLYVSYACPWAHRCLIARQLKGLSDHIDISVVSPHMGRHGWPFASVDKYPGATEDPINGARYAYDIYFKSDTNYPGRYTVPILWDKKTSTIVNNESSEIIRIFNSAFNDLVSKEHQAVDLYPVALRKEIDEMNEWVYDTVNNGVYKSGFAGTQEAYEHAVIPLFKSLDRLEAILKDGRDFLIGGQLTEADVRLFTTMIRFDPVYHGHFKCNLGTIRHDYPAINLWMKKLYWRNPAFKDTTNFDHIKEHYYWSHQSINPTRIVPLGPRLDIEPLDS